MYAAMRHYKFDAKYTTEVDQKIRQEFVPAIKKISGFISYYWLDSGVGEGASISVFKDKKGADESVRLAVQFSKDHLGGHIGPPEVVEGEVKAQA